MSGPWGQKWALNKLQDGFLPFSKFLTSEVGCLLATGDEISTLH